MLRDHPFLSTHLSLAAIFRLRPKDISIEVPGEGAVVAVRVQVASRKSFDRAAIDQAILALSDAIPMSSRGDAWRMEIQDAEGLFETVSGGRVSHLSVQEADSPLYELQARAQMLYDELVRKRVPEYWSGEARGATEDPYKTILDLQLALRDAVVAIRSVCNPLPAKFAEWERAAQLDVPRLHAFNRQLIGGAPS